MFTPRPYGRFADQAELSADDAAAVELLARRLSDYKQASSLDSMKMVRDLPSGRQAIAIDMGGVFRILITEQHETPAFKFEGIAQTNIPMLFSGVIKTAMVKDGKGVELKITGQCKKRLKNYKTEGETPPTELELQRFVIEYGEKFQYFKPEYTGIYTFTQYVKQRPTWYSGAMAQVMQVVGGYGRQVMAELPNDDIERARFLIPEKWMSQIRSQLGNVRLPGFTGFPDEKGQFQCEYSHGKSELVSFDDEDDPWLVQISSRGVFAMPLPVIPLTTTEAFRQYIEEVGDDEIIELLDRFGGMPSGETFPASQSDFESWKRAGVIIEVCDTSDFYEGKKAGFYEACGWSVNSKGTEGFNTCWEFDDSNLMAAYGYKLKLDLRSVADRGFLKNSWETNSQADTDQLNRYLSALYENLTGTGARELAIKYKIRSRSVGDLLSRNTNNMDAEINYWDNLKVDPIAEHSGGVTRSTSGPVWWIIPSPQSNAGLKFPTLNGEGCASFYLTSPDYIPDEDPVKCDTVVFGCYVDDSLKVVKYFIDTGEFKDDGDDNFEQCMFVGSWESRTTTGNSTMMGYFYTSDFDDRQVAPDVTTITTIKGSDLGFGEPLWSTPPILMRVGYLSRARYYQHVTTTSATKGLSIDAAICVPVFNRDAILYAFTENTNSVSESVEATMGGVGDPTSYAFWTDDVIFHYIGQTPNGNKGDPKPKEGAPVWLDTITYSPSDCSDFADSGDWFGFSGSFMDVTGVVGPYVSRKSAHPAGGVAIGGTPPGFEPYSKLSQEDGKVTGRASISMTIAGSVQVHANVPSTWYYALSPIQKIYFYRDSIFNAIGKADYASTSEGESSSGERKYWGSTAMADHKSPHHFIGVIND